MCVNQTQSTNLSYPCIISSFPHCDNRNVNENGNIDSYGKIADAEK